MSFTSINPTTGEVIKEYPGHTPEEIETALAKSATAFVQWRDTSFKERGDLMNRAAPEVLKAESQTGTPVADAQTLLDNITQAKKNVDRKSVV